MDVSIVDHSGTPIDRIQLGQLNLWNSTLEHICASTLQRLKELEYSESPRSVELK